MSITLEMSGSGLALHVRPLQMLPFTLEWPGTTNLLLPIHSVCPLCYITHAKPLACPIMVIPTAASNLNSTPCCPAAVLHVFVHLHVLLAQAMVAGGSAWMTTQWCQTNQPLLPSLLMCLACPSWHCVGRSRSSRGPRQHSQHPVQQVPGAVQTGARWMAV